MGESSKNEDIVNLPQKLVERAVPVTRALDMATIPTAHDSFTFSNPIFFVQENQVGSTTIGANVEIVEDDEEIDVNVDSLDELEQNPIQMLMDIRQGDIVTEQDPLQVPGGIEQDDIVNEQDPLQVPGGIEQDPVQVPRHIEQVKIPIGINDILMPSSLMPPPPMPQSSMALMYDMEAFRMRNRSNMMMGSNYNHLLDRGFYEFEQQMRAYGNVMPIVGQIEEQLEIDRRENVYSSVASTSRVVMEADDFAAAATLHMFGMKSYNFASTSAPTAQPIEPPTTRKRKPRKLPREHCRKIPNTSYCDTIDLIESDDEEPLNLVCTTKHELMPPPQQTPDQFLGDSPQSKPLKLVKKPKKSNKTKD